jgi:hypothetical protein
VKPPDPFAVALNVIRIYSDELANRGVKEETLIAALEVTGARAAEFLPDLAPARSEVITMPIN